jgi:hypothetical protein
MIKINNNNNNDNNDITLTQMNDENKYKDDINTTINTDIITKYMNQMVTHGLASEFNLSKRGDRWGAIEVIKNVTTNSDNNENIDNKHHRA